MPLEAPILLPFEHGIGRQFGPVVADDLERIAAQFGDAVQLSANPNAGDRVVDHRRQALTREIVDDAENAEPPTVDQGIRDEVQRPALVPALRDYLGRRLETVASRISWVERVPMMRLTTMKRQWGNCSPKGEITLNPVLVKAPRDCIDYVLMHELCHLKEHHHGPRFYEILGSEMPGWKPVKAKLDGMAELLLA